MAAYYCNEHKIALPAELFSSLKCPVRGCDSKLVMIWFSQVTPDWEEIVASLNDAAEYSHSTPLPIPDADIRVIVRDGMTWASHEALVACGYRNLCDFDVVLIQGKHYELQGCTKRSSVSGLQGNAWWIEEVPVEVSFVPLTVS